MLFRLIMLRNWWAEIRHKKAEPAKERCSAWRHFATANEYGASESNLRSPDAFASHKGVIRTTVGALLAAPASSLHAAPARRGAACRALFRFARRARYRTGSPWVGALLAAPSFNLHAAPWGRGAACRALFRFARRSRYRTGPPWVGALLAAPSYNLHAAPAIERDHPGVGALLAAPAFNLHAAPWCRGAACRALFRFARCTRYQTGPPWVGALLAAPSCRGAACRALL